MVYRKYGWGYILRLDKGEDVVKTIVSFCRTENLKFGLLTGIGALENAALAYFEPGTKEYHIRHLEGSYEAVSISGNITIKDGEIVLHCHAALAAKDLRVLGGHLVSAYVSATLEVFILNPEGEAIREFDKETGLHLIKI